VLYDAVSIVNVENTMAVRSSQNQYLGVNAHLHSDFQSKGGWASFHTGYINDLARAINSKLPPGYLVDIERSLQIREYHPDTGERLRRPEPDITICETETSARRAVTVSSGGSVLALTQPIIETIELDDDQYYSALVIYQLKDDATFGRPVTRIEVLSPTNKDGDGYLQYREKRAATLKSGTCLVEIDYLHETQSPVKGVPNYRRHQPGSFPYNITVSNPTPDLETGLALTIPIGVDEVIPTIDIPLAGDDVLALDFGAVYNITYRSLGAYSYRVDYEQLPEHFETYDETDQERIRRRMRIVLDVHQRGLNLEDGPFPGQE
jgi:hypothetical protein